MGTPTEVPVPRKVKVRVSAGIGPPGRDGTRRPARRRGRFVGWNLFLF
jgi:hypothetical protein